MQFTHFNPRARYLTGMGIMSPSRLGAFNPRARYLTGWRLGQDSSDFDYTSAIQQSLATPPIVPGSGIDYSAAIPPAVSETITAPLSLPSGYIGPTSGTVVSSTGAPLYSISPTGQATPLTAAASAVGTNWWAGTTAGISNTTLVLLLGGLALLAIASSGGSSSRRRNPRAASRSTRRRRRR